MPKRVSKAWESWEDDFVISRIKAGVTGKVTAAEFAQEHSERGRSEASVTTRYVVLRDRLASEAMMATAPRSTLVLGTTCIYHDCVTRGPQASHPSAATCLICTDRARKERERPPKEEAPAEKGWRKVRSPKRWTPGDGEILEGTYLGPKKADGQFGAYTQHLIADANSRVHYVSGTVLDGLFVSSLAQPGARVRVVFLGKKGCASGEGTFKDFDLFVKESEE